ncbi:ornithine cyclodeaminase family protein [Pseudooceanicola aestuarii]|uniref:ornithine cyclodeaminase family protein n=1 Tax=Pseudooceanicola aestuarii TaxID=2697319 RepID=UPI0013D670EA|nr:ornithine cyclodeaminase [Pseudooceanicola aestuarii]
MTAPFITFEQGESVLDWIALSDAIAAGHDLPKAEIGDTFLYRGEDTLLSRSAWITGLGVAVKTATIFPGNKAQGRPAVNGATNLFSDETGMLDASIDFHLITKWKTAGDSLLAARRLARPDSRRILLIGAGTVATNMRAAYATAFPDAEFTVWNRSPAGAEAMASAHPGMQIATSLEQAVARADIICCATMATEPVLRGAWLQPGQHVDLIGAYHAGMREADDDALRRASLFVDSRDTTLDHIGELKTPLADGVITPDDIRADYYQLGTFARQSEDEITLAKNGGGAHLDLMVARHILTAWTARHTAE